jgi:ribonuclease HI
MIKIYTDGSYSKKDNTCGYGICIIDTEDPDKIIQLKGGVYHKDYKSMWNVGGEIAAVEAAINFCMENNLNDITIYHDYIGLSKWITGEWKTKNAVTINYKVNVELAKRNMNIKFVHVKGHSGDKYNDLVDKLANEGRLIKEKEIANESFKN